MIIYNAKRLRTTRWLILAAVALGLLSLTFPATGKVLEDDIDVPGLNVSESYKSTSEDDRYDRAVRHSDNDKKDNAAAQIEESRTVTINGKTYRIGDIDDDDKNDNRSSIRIRSSRSHRTERIIIRPPDDHLKVRVWTDHRSYVEGEAIRIYFWANEDSYLYIYDTDTRGDTRQIFPNYFDRDNFIRGGRVYSIPDRGYNLTVTGPEGREYLEAIAVSHHRNIRLPHHDWRRSEPFPRCDDGADYLERQLRDLSRRYDYDDDGRSRITREYEYRQDRSGITVTPKRRHDIRRVDYDYKTARDTTSFYVKDRIVRRSYGYLDIDTEPENARVYIDEHYIGPSDVRVRLSVGRHTVRIERTGYKTERRVVYIISGRTTTLDINLNRDRHSRGSYRYYRDEDSDDWSIRFRVNF